MGPQARVLFSLVLTLASVGHADMRPNFRGTIRAVETFNDGAQPTALKNLRARGATNEQINSFLDHESIAHVNELGMETGRTLVFLLTVAAMDLAITQAKALLSGYNDAPRVTWEMAGQAALKVVDSGTTWGSFLSGGIAGGMSGKIIDPALRLIGTLAQNPRTHAALVGQIRAGVMTTGAFLGWDAGAQLVAEARYLISDDKDFARADALFSVGTGALAHLVTSRYGSEQDVRVAREMLFNVLKIALFNQDLRSAWLNNAIRTRYFNGKFMVMLSSTFAASAVGTAIFPGAGTLGGFMFGIAGAGVALIVPAPVTDRLTGVISGARIGWVQAALDANANMLKNTLGPALRATPLTEAQSFRIVDRLLRTRQNLRSRYLTIEFEKAHLSSKQLFDGSDLAQKRFEIKDEMDEAQAMLAADQRLFDQLAQINSISASKSQLGDEVERVRQVKCFVNGLGSISFTELRELNAPAKLDQVSVDGRKVLNFFDGSYARAYDESSTSHDICD